VKVWRNLKKFDKNKNFKAWLFSVAKNTAIDFFRKRKYVPFCELEKDGELFGDMPDLSPLPDEISERRGWKEIYFKND